MKLSRDIVEIIERSECDGNALRLPAGQLDRKTYEAVNAALSAAGGKWDKRSKAHLFDGDAAVAVEPIILTGEIQKPSNFDFFWSPPAVVDRVMALAKIRPGMSVLEPSAGDGRIALAAIAAGGDVTCIELQPKNVAKLVAAEFPVVTEGDFLKTTHLDHFDVVAMNPPFSGQADIDHVRHAFAMLRPGGRLVSVMSASVTFRTNKKTVEFREWVASLGGAIEDLPPGSFKAAGTDVSACIVTLPMAA